jgi:hypothetical protein
VRSKYSMVLLALTAVTLFGVAAAEDPIPLVEVPLQTTPDHPAFASKQFTTIVFDAEAIDAVELQTLAESVLWFKRKMSLAEAQDYLLVDGHLDIARCVEVVIQDSLDDVPRALRIRHVSISLQHPLPATLEPIQEGSN